MELAIRKTTLIKSNLGKYEISLPKDFNISKEEIKGLEIIYCHSGKRRTFEAYLKYNREMAGKYLRFISRHRHVQYVIWDAKKNKFDFAI